MKYDLVGQPYALCALSVNKWPVSALGQTITHPSRHTGIFVPEAKEANISADKASWVVLAMEFLLEWLYWGMVS